MEKIIISVVCYNNEKEVLDFASQLSVQSLSDNIVLLVTCNKCEDISAFEGGLSQHKIETHLYNPLKNLGYLPGALYGINAYAKEVATVTYQWVIICNTDITLCDASFFAGLLSKNINPQIWSIAPNIIYKTNNAKQNPFLLNRLTKSKMRFYKMISDNFLLFFLYGSLSMLKKKVAVSNKLTSSYEYIYSAHGSFFILRKECIDILSHMKLDIFMYGEEILIAEVLREQGAKTIYCKDLMLVHNENATTSLIPQKKKCKWYNDSIRYLYAHFYKDGNCGN